MKKKKKKTKKKKKEFQTREAWISVETQMEPYYSESLRKAPHIMNDRWFSQTHAYFVFSSSSSVTLILCRKIQNILLANFSIHEWHVVQAYCHKFKHIQMHFYDGLLLLLLSGEWGEREKKGLRISHHITHTHTHPQRSIGYDSFLCLFSLFDYCFISYCVCMS